MVFVGFFREEWLASLPHLPLGMSASCSPIEKNVFDREERLVGYSPAARVSQRNPAATLFSPVSSASVGLPVFC